MAPRAKTSAWVTTEEVCAAVGRSKATILRWSRLGVLPPYKTIYARGRSARWPAHAPAQARWVDRKLAEGHTFAEILAALERGEFVPESSDEEG